jgi:hypothetical protein
METKTWRFSIGSNQNRNLSKYSLEELSESLTYALKHKTYLACFSQDEFLTGDHTKDIYARAFGKSRMWAQYAANHTGICLVLEKYSIRKAAMEQFKDDRFRIYGGPVDYRDRLITEVNNPMDGFVVDADYLEKLGLDEYIHAHVKTHHKALFFEKVTDWSKENEFRIVVFAGENEEHFIDISNAIAGVLFGANCDEKNINRIVDLCNQGNTQFEQIVWRNSTPWYSFSRTEWMPKTKQAK